MKNDPTNKKTAVQRTGAESARIALAVREDILDGKYDAGEVLRQERLADTYSSSRMPVRDALRILEKQGFVTAKRNRGAVVCGLDPLELQEVYEMRSALETLALRKAIPEFSNRYLDEVSAILDQAENSEISQFSDLNRAFHLKLYAPCRRPRLLEQVSILNDIADRYLRVAAAQLSYADRSNEEHRKILKACRRRDEEAAVDCLKRHIEDAGQALYKELSGRSLLTK